MTDSDFPQDKCEECGGEFGDEEVRKVVRVKREQEGEVVTTKQIDKYGKYYHPDCLDE